MLDLSNFMLDLSASPRRRRAGVGARGVSYILLVSWLFTLLVCLYNDFHKTSTDAVKDTPAAHERNGLEHSGGAQDTDICCTIMQNPPIFSKVGNIDVSLQDLIYVLPPYIFVVQTALLITASVFYFCVDPLGKTRHSLTANVLWPNAPPR